MPLLDLVDAAHGLSDARKSRVLAQAGGCNVKRESGGTREVSFSDCSMPVRAQ
ncbi:MAG: hypothetical protein ACN6O8_04075 [Achromobacter sp.]|uniref:hypothetical protein n=1 Tax=Achromobacter sp. TaxID=134375 RepID=UPI003D03BD38